MRSIMLERPQLHMEIVGEDLTDTSQAQFKYYHSLAEEFPDRFAILEWAVDDNHAEVLIYRPETWS